MAKKAFKKKYTDQYKLSRDKEDELDALKKRVVKFKDLIEFTGTPDQFLSRITTKFSGYLYIKCEGLTHLWWHDDEKWFMNIAYQNFKSIEKGEWFIAKDLPAILQTHIRRVANYILRLSERLL